MRLSYRDIIIIFAYFFQFFSHLLEVAIPNFFHFLKG